MNACPLSGTCALLLAATCLASPAGLPPAAAQETKAPRQESRVIRWEDTRVHQADWGTMHRYLTGETFATDKAYVAAAVVQPGKAVHQEHRHAEEEYLAIVAGEGTWTLDGEQLPAKRGDLLYVEPWVYHGVTNTGSEPLVFLVIKYNGKGTPPPPRPDDRPDERSQAGVKDDHGRGTRPAGRQAPIAGVVTLDGAPVPNARVVFESLDGRRRFTTRTNARGEYSFPTGWGESTLQAGEYRVTVQGDEGRDPAPPADAKETLPPKYADPKTSGLKIQTAPGANVIDLELSDG